MSNPFHRPRRKERSSFSHSFQKPHSSPALEPCKGFLHECLETSADVGEQSDGISFE